MNSLWKSLAGVIAFMVGIWLVGQLVGLHFSLLWSLALSVVLTLLINGPRLLSQRR